MDLYVIYDHPSDFPDYFVVRKWEIGETGITVTRECQLADTLPQAREQVPRGLYCIPRHETDDAVIVETWI